VEDAVYSMTVSFFLEEDKHAVFRPHNYREAYALTPLSEHEREKSAKPVLFSQLVNELHASVAAKMIESIGFTAFKKQTVLSDDELESLLGDALDSTWEEFNMDNNKENLSSAVKLFKGDYKKEVKRISSLEKKNAGIPLDEAKQVLDDFSFTLKAWPYVTGALEDEKTKKKILGL
jgi:hypothetical protein